MHNFSSTLYFTNTIYLTVKPLGEVLFGDLHIMARPGYHPPPPLLLLFKPLYFFKPRFYFYCLLHRFVSFSFSFSKTTQALQVVNAAEMLPLVESAKMLRIDQEVRNSSDRERKKAV